MHQQCAARLRRALRMHLRITSAGLASTVMVAVTVAVAVAVAVTVAAADAVAFWELPGTSRGGVVDAAPIMNATGIVLPSRNAALATPAVRARLREDGPRHHCCCRYGQSRRRRCRLCRAHGRVARPQRLSAPRRRKAHVDSTPSYSHATSTRCFGAPGGRQAKYSLRAVLRCGNLRVRNRNVDSGVRVGDHIDRYSRVLVAVTAGAACTQLDDGWPCRRQAAE